MRDKSYSLKAIKRFISVKTSARIFLMVFKKFLLFSIFLLAFFSSPPAQIRPTQYPVYNHCYNERMALATLLIDSLRNNLDQYGSSRNTLIVYSVLSIAPFDTSIYTNAEEMFPQSGDKWIDTNILRYDTMGFPRYFVDSMGIQNPRFSVGDTLRNIFILQSDYSNGLAFWSISYAQDTSFLHESNPPFPLKQALRSFNLYLNQNSIYKGFRPPKNG